MQCAIPDFDVLFSDHTRKIHESTHVATLEMKFGSLSIVSRRPQHMVLLFCFFFCSKLRFYGRSFAQVCFHTFVGRLRLREMHSVVIHKFRNRPGRRL